MLEPILKLFPLWLIGLILIAACLFASEAGRFVHRRNVRRNPKAQRKEKSDSEGYIIGAIFGLLAFVIGLTFSIAVDRFDDRRAWVAQEATAINTAFLRASLFDEPYCSRLQLTLREYARTRIAPNGRWDDKMDRQVKRSHELRQTLWDETHAAVYPVRTTELGSSLLEAIGDTLTVGTRRELSGQAHIPNRIFNALLLYLLVASAVLGYLMGDETGRMRTATALLFALFAAAIILILDLDSPRAGSIQVSQQSLEALLANLDRVDLPMCRR